MGGKSKQTTTNSNAQGVFDSAKATLGNSTYHPVDASQIQSYMNPYKSSVIDATLNRNNQNQEMALNGNRDRAIRAGAFDTTGLSVENALTRGQFDQNNQQTIAGLNDQNYGQALQTATGQNDAQSKYPLAIQALLSQLAQGSGTTTTSQKPIDWGSILSAAGSAAQGAAALRA